MELVIFILIQICVFVSCITTTQTQTNNDVTTVTSISFNTTRDNNSRPVCLFNPSSPVTNVTRLRCCNRTIQDYYFNWATVSESIDLTKFLEVLRGWNCPQLEEECRDRTFAHNTYTSLVYDLYCNYESVATQCVQTVEVALENARKLQPFTVVEDVTQYISNEDEFSGSSPNDRQFVSKEIQKWRDLTAQIAYKRFNVEDLSEPCVQVAIYDAKHKEPDFVFYEVNQLDIPACSIIWCGLEGSYIEEYGLSAWTCMPSRARVITTMVVCALLAIAVTIANLSVISVILYNPKLRTSPGIYRLSLAIADLLVGLIVLPTFISSLARRTTTLVRRPNQQFAMQGLNLTNNVLTSRATSASYSYMANFPTPYVSAIGFFTTLSLAVSVYILAAAGFDRLLAVYRPIKYGRFNAKKWTKRVCVTLWIVGIVLSILPFLTPSLSYGIVVSFVVSLTGRQALVIYIILGAIPIVIMWGVSIATYIVLKKKTKVMTELSNQTHAKREAHVAKTLVLMVVVLTLSVLPVAVVSIVSLTIPTAVAQEPRLLVVRDVVAVNTSEFISTLILVLNSLWNFFIYSNRDKGFRRAVKNMYRNTFENLGDLIGRCWSHAAYGGRRLSAGVILLTRKTRNDDFSQNQDTTGVQINKTVTINGTLDPVATQTNVETHKRKSGRFSKIRKTFRLNKKDKVSEAGDDSVFLSYQPSKGDFVAQVMEDVDRKVFSKSSVSSLLTPNNNKENTTELNLEAIQEVGKSEENVFFPESMEIEIKENNNQD